MRLNFGQKVKLWSCVLDEILSDEFQFPIFNESIILGNFDHMNGLQICVWVPWIMSWSVGSSSDEKIRCKPWSVKTLIWCIWWTWGLINLKWCNLAFEYWWRETLDLHEWMRDLRSWRSCQFLTYPLPESPWGIKP